MPRRKMHGFTVIELLTVVAVIAVLMSLLLPALSAAREQSKTVRCAVNLRQVGVAFQMYAMDWNDVIIPIGAPSGPYNSQYYGPYWAERCSNYFKYVKDSRSNIDVLRCPAAQDQIRPRWDRWINQDMHFTWNYGLNGNVCGGALPTGWYAWERKFNSLQGVVVLAADGKVSPNGGLYECYVDIDSGKLPWPFDPYVGPFAGHNNKHYANMLFSDFHLEPRNKSPKTSEWKDK